MLPLISDTEGKACWLWGRGGLGLPCPCLLGNRCDSVAVSPSELSFWIRKKRACVGTFSGLIYKPTMGPTHAEVHFLTLSDSMVLVIFQLRGYVKVGLH